EAQVELGLGDLAERLGDRDRRVVHQHVPPAERGEHVLHHRLILGPAGDIGGGRDRGPAGRLDPGDHPLGPLGGCGWLPTTRPPPAASAAAMALPIPVAAPVTRAALPCKDVVDLLITHPPAAGRPAPGTGTAGRPGSAPASPRTASKE